jgi:hypothetical protein
MRSLSLLCLLVFVCARSASLQATQPFHELPGSDEWTLGGHVARYCAEPPFGAYSEAQPPLPGYALAQAQVLVRHGDRSNIGSFPGTPRQVFECGEPTAASTARYAQELALFRSSVPCILAGGSGAACEGIVGEDLGNSSDSARFSWGAPKAAGKACSVGGELSTVGWRQLRGVGQALGGAYRGLLTDDTLLGPRFSTPLLVVSTDTGRTALSAASLLGGVLEAVLPEWPPSPAAHSAEPGGGGAGGGDAPFGEPLGGGRSTSAPPLASASLSSGGGEGGTPLLLLPNTTTTTPTAVMTSVHPPSPRSLSTFLIPGINCSAIGGPIPGLALPLPLHVLPREADVALWPKKAHVCAAAAVEQEEREEDMFQHQVLPADLAARIAHAAGVEADALPTVEEFADDLLTRHCHKLPLPCWAPRGSGNGSAGAGAGAGNGSVCLEASAASAILERCDTGYAHRFTNRVTDVLTFPLLKHLSDALARAAALWARGGRSASGNGAMDSATSSSGSDSGSGSGSESGSGSNSGSVPRLVLRSVHDTVLAPLLSTLGAQSRPYAWPNYASRVTLELWVPQDVGGAQQQQQLEQQPLHQQPLLSLLYNGVDITHRLKCSVAVGGEKGGGGGGGEGGGEEEGKGSGSLRRVCTLDAFAAQVGRLLGSHASWEDACKSDKAPPPPEAHPPTGKKRRKASAAGSDVGCGAV